MLYFNKIYWNKKTQKCILRKFNVKKKKEKEIIVLKKKD